MATRWSSEFLIAEHRDLQASAMAADWTGTFVLLAGRRYLGLKKLDDPSDMLKKIPRQSKYDVGTAEWNPNANKEDLCAISSNQRVEIHKLSNNDLTQVQLLNAHTRVVTDLNWHRFCPDLLASCSIDTYTHIWDMRDSRRPALSLSSVAGANQVRWNRLSRYLLATAHNGDIRLWDQRKGTAPVQYITAHLANIHGLDWSQTHENQLATSSQDGTVKFFDTTNPRRAENIISVAAPVWRARYTPFGEGLIMVVVPPMRRGENSLLLWNLGNPSAPVHTFVGHTDTVLEFEWRRHKHDPSDYQLITWSKDQTLRIWQIEPFLQKLCGYDPNGENPASADILVSSSALESEGETEILIDTPSSTLSEESPSESDVQVSSSSSQTGLSQPKTLQQEFSLINVNIRNISFEKMDAVRRTCCVKVSVNFYLVLLHITFPPSYPYGSAPTFHFATGSTIDIVVKAKLLKVLKHTAQQRVHRNRSCLEPCLRQLVVMMEQLTNNEETDKTIPRHQISPVSLIDHSSILTSFHDGSVPFPRTSGAKFCSVGLLVTFGRTVSARRLSSRPDAQTPRSLSALPDPVLTMSSSYFFNERAAGVPVRPRVGRPLVRGSIRGSKAQVVIYDTSPLFFVQRNLAENYIYDWHNVTNMCQRNAAVAANLGRRDLLQAWSLATLASTQPAHDQDDDFPWQTHPLARGMLQSIIWHYAKQYDVQMAAMLTCVFSSRLESSSANRNKCLNKATNPSPGGSPYHTIHQVDTSLQGWNFSVMKQNRSNSWSESIDDCRLSNIVEHFSVHTEIDRSLEMDESYIYIYDEYKRVYADILHRWKLLDARTQVLKYMSTAPEPHRGMELKADCQYCRKPGQDAHCTSCKRPTVQCTICHLSVKGSMSSCLVCGHGGHAQHMENWFRNESVCPSGCGCHCLVESASVLDF